MDKIGDIFEITQPGFSPTKFKVILINDDGYYVSPVDGPDIGETSLIVEQNRKYKVSGSDIDYKFFDISRTNKMIIKGEKVIKIHEMGKKVNTEGRKVIGEPLKPLGNIPHREGLTIPNNFLDDLITTPALNVGPDEQFKTIQDYIDIPIMNGRKPINIKLYD